MSRKERPKIDPATIEKILLIRLRRIGDVVMTTPAVAALKKSLPHAHLTYIVEEPYRRLVEGNPHLDSVISLPLNQGFFSFLGFVRKLRRVKYDALIDFHGGPRASQIALLSRASLKIGYDLKYKRFYYHLRLPRALPGGAPIHSVENHLNLIRALGIPVSDGPPLELPTALPGEKERVERLWTQNDLEGNRTVVLHVGAGNVFRDWGAENLAALIELLERIPGVRVILVGSTADKVREREIQERISRPALSLVGNLNLIELREVFSRAALFVGPDSGPMHIAAAARTPIVALFGPTLPENFAPWQAEATIIARDFACRPCRQRRCTVGDYRCLRTITPEEVYAACLVHLELRELQENEKTGDN